MGAHVSEFVVQLNSCINNNPNVTDNNYTYMLGEHGITFSKAKVDMFIQWMRRVATSVIATLNMRFPKEEFFDSLKFIDPTYLRESQDKSSRYGVESIKAVCERYPIILDQSVAIIEWDTLRHTIALDHTGVKHIHDILQMKDLLIDYPQIYKIASIICCIPVSSSQHFCGSSAHT